MSCPCCGQTIPSGMKLTFSDEYHTIMRDGRCVMLTPMQYAIVKAVSRYGLTIEQIGRTIYSDRADGGPLTIANTISVQIVKANERLKLINLRIGAERKGAWAPPYRIVDVARPAA